MGKNSRLKKQEPNRGKNIKLNENGNQKIDYPIFCFRNLHPDYSVETCELDDREKLIIKLTKLSQITWLDIQLSPKHGMGSEKINRTAIKPSIPLQITNDVDSFLALRYNGKKAMIGYRSGPIFHLVYIDYNFSVYNH